MRASRRVLVARGGAVGPRFAPTAATAKVLGLLVVPVAVIATGVGVVGASYSAFNSVTSGPGTSWSTGNVALANDAGSAAFSTTGLKPGSFNERCIVVTSTGTVPANVRLYGTAPSATNNLSNALQLTITPGTGGGLGSCTGFSAASGATPWTGSLTAFDGLTGYSNGVLQWATTGSGTQTQTYKIAWSLPTSTDNSAQSLTAGVTFTWEAQNS